MTEHINLPKTGLDRRPVLEIPWMRRWEKKERVRSTTIDDPPTRMDEIDYMAMLEELEFH